MSATRGGNDLLLRAIKGQARRGSSPTRRTRHEREPVAKALGLSLKWVRAIVTPFARTSSINCQYRGRMRIETRRQIIENGFWDCDQASAIESSCFWPPELAEGGVALSAVRDREQDFPVRRVVVERAYSRGPPTPYPWQRLSELDAEE